MPASALCHSSVYLTFIALTHCPDFSQDTQCIKGLHIVTV
jgi:hypothetical protein